MKFIKEEIYQALQYQRNNNTSLTKAAKQYGVDRHTLSAYQGFDFSTCIYAQEEHQYIQLTPKELQAVQEYQNGILPTVLSVKQKFGFHSEKFRQMCQYMHVPTRQDNIKYYFNRNAFHSIQTEEDAYILGFLTADGYICESRSSVNLKIHSRDIDILHKINKYLKGDLPIHEAIHQTTKEQLVYLYISSEQIIQNLNQYGLHQAKSLKETFYQGMPEHLLRHYIRGLIDGDGFITKEHGHIGMCGSYDVLLNVSQQIAKHIDVEFEPERKLRCETTNRNKPLWRFELSGPAARAAMRWLYEGSNIHLDRKYNLAKQYVNLL